jgi:hypothetical protein
MVLIPQPQYSSDLVPMKLKLKEWRFGNIEAIKAESQRVIDTLIEKDFQEAFQKWKRRRDRCIHERGKYLEAASGRRAL